MRNSRFAGLLHRLALSVAVLAMALTASISQAAAGASGAPLRGALPYQGPQRIQFAPGGTSAAVSGNLAAGGVDAYILRAGAGQTMRVALLSDSGEIYISISGADDGAQLLDMAARATSWTGLLPASQDYRIYVAAAGKGGSYTLRVEIPPHQPAEPTPQAPAPTPPAPTPRPTSAPEKPGDTDKVVYLTFDDGPHPEWTPKVLALLERYNASGTFFVLGEMVERNPRLLDRIFEGGHAAGNHGYSHRSLAGLGRQAFYNEVRRTAELIGPRGARLLRPPYGALDSLGRTYAAELGYGIALWTIDPRDWARPGAAQIASHVLQRVEPGSVVLLHDGGGPRTQTVAALETILRELTARGYRFAPMSD